MRYFIHLAVILITMSVLTTAVIAQERAVVPKAKRDVAVIKPAKAIKFDNRTTGDYVPGMKSASLLADDQIGQTIYDLQTNSCMQNRLYLYDDGSM